MVGTAVGEVAVATIIQAKQRSKNDRTQRWARLERADLWERYDELHTQRVSQRQAAKVLDVPRSTLQAWRLSQASLDACPAVVAFFQSVPGLAFLHQLVIACITLSTRKMWCHDGVTVVNRPVNYNVQVGCERGRTQLWTRCSQRDG
jgi:hypothetical protein